MSKGKSLNKSIANIYSLTALQEGMLYHNLMNNKSTSYVIQSVYDVHDEIDENILRDSLELLSRKHDVLRTIIMHEKVSVPRQVVLKSREIEYEMIDLTNLTQSIQNERISEVKESDVQRGFILQKDSLMRVKLLKLQNNRYKLIWSIHHIIMDGWCLAIIFGDLKRYYDQLENGVTKSTMEKIVDDEKLETAAYGEYIKWLEKQDKSKGLGYWNKLLSGYEHVAEIQPVNFTELGEKKVDQHITSISREKTEQLKYIASSNNVTLNNVMEVVWGIILQKYNQTNDVVFGKVVSGRHADIKNIEKIVGLFVNTIPFRFTCNEETTAVDLFKASQLQGLDSNNFDYCSLAEIQNNTQLRSDLIKTLFVFENYFVDDENKTNNELGFNSKRDAAREETHYKINLSVYVKNDHLHYKIMYDPSMYHHNEIEMLLNRIKKIIDQIIDNPNVKVSDIELITTTEQELIMNNFNDTAFDYSRERTIIEIFEDQVEKTPNNIAVAFKKESLTYKALNNKANQLAVKLRKMGVRPNDFVAIASERSLEMIIGIYGILKAGGAYVPIDPTYPEDRIHFMIDDCKPVCVLFNNVDIEMGIPVIELDKHEEWQETTHNLDRVNNPSDRVYCIYTSGTTGRPKGVINKHSGLLNLLMWLQRSYPMDESDAILQKTTYVFDVSTSEIFWWPLVGARLVMLKPEAEKEPQEILETIDEHQVSVINFVPSMLSLFVKDLERNPRRLKSIKYIISAGEALNAELVHDFYSVMEENILLANLYGPTETSVYTTSYNCNPSLKRVPIGKPIGNSKAYILNGTQLCGIGMPGELCITGEGVTNGYLNRAKLTNDVFVNNPFGEGKMYRTGDLVRWLPDGNIDFLGRLDDQVKIRGFRIELGEITNQLLSMEDIIDAFTAVKEKDNDKSLHAYIVSNKKIDLKLLKINLGNYLPEYMIPTYIMQIEEIPVNNIGKVDKKALPEIEVKSQNEFIAPRNDIEKNIAKVFEEVLSLNKVGIKDNFFDLGGHSLRATRLVNRIESEIGIRLPLKAIFKNPTIEDLSQLLKTKSFEDYKPIPNVESKSFYPMSSTQKRMYMIYQLDSEVISYNMPQGFKLYGEVSIDRIKDSFQKLINRHEILRTNFLMIDGELVQIINEQKNVSFEFEENSSTNEDDLMTLFVRPFDLENELLLRVKLIKRENHHLLLLDMHHIIGDGMSTVTFINEFNMLYQDKSLDKLTHQYKDYSEWMRTRDLSVQKEYWINEFDGDIPVLDMPLDYNRPQEQSFNGGSVSHDLDNELSLQLSKLASKTGTTEYMIYLSALMITLSKYTHQEDIVVGSPVSGRTHKDTENMLGMFINTLVMRGYPIASKKYIDFLREVKEISLKSYEHQDYPFEELVEAIDINRDISRNPLFDVMLVLQNNENTQYEIDNVRIENLTYKSTVAKFDLLFTIYEFENQTKIKLGYRSDLFKAESADRILKHFVNILHQISMQYNSSICDLELISENEKACITRDFNDTSAYYPNDKTVVDLFEEQVKDTPNATAVVFNNQVLTYSELNEKANQLARKLRALGVKPDELVPLLANRSLEMFIGIYGILKAGGAYVPMDPSYPKDRIDYMIEDCQPKAIVSYGDFTTHGPVIDLSTLNTWEEETTDLMPLSKPNHLIYCLYTSGTTGRPKGVMVEHKGVVNLCTGLINKIYTDHSVNRVALLAAYVFDASVQNIFAPLISGRTLYLTDESTRLDPDQLLSYIYENDIEGIDGTPTHLKLFKGNLNQLTKLKVALIGGEKLEPSIVNAFKQLDLEIYNVYGPTETTVDCTSYLCTETSSRSVSIGKPVSNTQIYILNDNQLCGIGIPGELCIAGDGVSRGYLNRPELTMEKFVDNPYGEGKMYRSGDLARWLPDGNIEYIGRLDDQVKIRGFRIELGEITNQLLMMTDIRDAVVVVNDEVLHAYLVSDETLDLEEIKVKLSNQLPDYMIPTYMMQIEKMPVTRNGKIDKKALPKIEVKSQSTFIAPRNELEQKVADIFEEILGVKGIGIKDNFFNLGGHSLRATRLMNRIESEIGIRLPLKVMFKNPTVEGLSQLLETETVDSYTPIPKAEPKDCYQMSSTQKRMYLIHRLDPESVSYNMPQGIRLKGDVNEDKIKKAIDQLVTRHEILRTNFMMVDGELVQRIHEGIETVEVIMDTQTAESELLSTFTQPFNLEEGPLLRVKLVKRDNHYLMLLDMHHIISDGMSMGTFIDEFNRLYNEEELKAPTHQYKDYSEWMHGRDLSEQKDYWVHEFSDEIPVLDMPLDFTRPQEQSFKGHSVTESLDESLSNELKELASKTGTTEYMILLSALMVTLSKYSRQEDIVIGSPVSGRTHKDTEHMLGMFINTLAMRGRPEGSKKYRDFLEEVKESCLKAYEYQEYPFEELVEAVDVKRDMSRNPLFDVMLVLQNNEKSEFDLNDVVSDYIQQENTISKFDLSFNMYFQKGRLLVNLEYSTDLYKLDSIKRILNHFIVVLTQIVLDVDCKIENIEAITKNEKAQILNAFNHTALDYPRDKTITALFEEQVEKTPDSVAVVYEEEALTYLELNERANILARKLRTMGVKPDDFVAIMAERSIEMIVGIYGIIKAGGAYVPLDPTYPKDRVDYILEDCNPRAVLCYKASLETEITMIDLADHEIWLGSSQNPEIVNKPSDLVYCIYTSGTTGKPKGVLIEHRNLHNLVKGYEVIYGLTEFDTVLQFANIVFDQSVWDIFNITLIGGKVCMISNGDIGNPRKLEKYMNDKKVTVAAITPAYIRELIPENLPQLRLIESGGAAAEIQTLKQWTTNRQVFNTYGPTEATVNTITYEMSEGDEYLPIGKPAPNSSVYILNKNELCGIGVPGEICLGGDCVSRGYLNMPELTEEKFIDNPFGKGKLYRTGDMAKWLSDGNLAYLGRVDDQVKIRGFRIELSEIESELLAIANVKDAVVVAMDDQGDKALNAYIVSDAKMSISDIRENLRKKLPNYMIPSYMMQIDKIPITRNGKIDRKVLPKIDVKSEKIYIAPRNETEKQIIDIFEDVLGIERISIKDNFFELGGHSLRATRVVNRIESMTGVRLPLKAMFTSPTVEELSELIVAKDNEDFAAIPIAMKQIHYPMSSVQKRMYLINQMDKESIAYNIPQSFILKGDVKSELIHKTIHALTKRHEILRTNFLMIDGEFYQKVNEDFKVDYRYLEDCTTDEVNLLSRFIKPFDLETDALLRFILIKREGYYLLMVDMHHIISDGMSIGTFLDEFNQLYNGNDLDELTHQYKDYSQWMNSRDLTEQKNYWIDEFKDEIPVLDMPLDFVRPQVQSYNGQSISKALNIETINRLRQLAARTGTTEYMIMLSALMVTLSKYSRQEEIIVGTPMSGRTHRDTEKMLGMFVNTLAIKGLPEARKNYSDFLSEVKESCLKAYEHQEYPFEELVEVIEVKRDLSRNPLFDVMLVLQNNENIELDLNNVDFEYVRQNETVAKFDLTFNVYLSEKELNINLDYCLDLFKEDTASRILEHYVHVLDQILQDEDIRICDVEIITSEEKSLILNEFNHTDMDYPSQKTMTDLFEDQVALYPNKIAAVFEERALTYSEINGKANQLARKLRSLGVQPNDFVALLTERNIEMIIGIMGILKAGGAYVPMDPSYPKDRIDYMIEDCQPKAVVVNKVKVDTEVSVIDLADNSKWNELDHNLEKVSDINDLAYCIYTSGTTGKPKGVMVEHRGISNLREYFIRVQSASKSDKVLQFASFVFDAMISELAMSILNGGELHIISERIKLDIHLFEKYVQDHGITMMVLPPQYAAQVAISHVRSVITAGSKSNKSLVESFNNTQMYSNDYGPTETTVCATHWTSKNKDEIPSNVPIGKPINNTHIYILQGNKLNGIGIPGEVCIAGVGLARGYLNMPELTQEKFVTNLFGDGKMYRTGDLARWLPDGNIEYLGRTDEQVKVRGFRIELGEVENQLIEFDYVKEAVVIVKEDQNGDGFLNAYVVVEEEIDVEYLKNALGKTLPEYMMPSFIIQIEEMPVTRNGKIDYSALSKIEIKSQRVYVAPKNEKEEKLTAIFEEILGIDKVSLSDKFFELGGDSIKAIRVVSKMREAGFDLSAKDIMQKHTIRDIAEYAEVSGLRVYDQGEVVGTIVSTPIMRNFESWELMKPHHFNQSTMIKVDSNDESKIQMALEAIMKHHDILRSVYINHSLKILSMDEVKCELRVVDRVDGNNLKMAIEDACNEQQCSMDLEQGPLIKAALFKTGAGSYLSIIIHHLVVDVVSWSILIEDFKTALNQLNTGRKITLPAKTASFKEWSEALEEYKESHLLKNEQIYWNDIISEISKNQIDFQAKSEYGSTTVTFSQIETDNLLYKAGKAFNTEINDLLLSAVGMAYHSIFKVDKMIVGLEGHGREEIHKTIDIDRTVGWFTSVYPVVIECKEDVQLSIVSTKDMLRKVPNNGLGYGLLADTHHELAFYFNYLGEVESSDDSFSTGDNIANENKLDGFMTMNGSVRKGQLSFEIAYDKGVYSENTIENFAERYRTHLVDIVNFCTSQDETVVTVSDYSSDDLSSEDLQMLEDLF